MATHLYISCTSAYQREILTFRFVPVFFQPLKLEPAGSEMVIQYVRHAAVDSNARVEQSIVSVMLPRLSVSPPVIKMRNQMLKVE